MFVFRKALMNPLAKTLVKPLFKTNGMLFAPFALYNAAQASTEKLDYQLNDLEKANIAVTVKLTELRKADAPLYISIQNRDEYQTNRGYGGIVKAIDKEILEVDLAVDIAGDYAISVWHDLDNDGEFSMSDTYIPLDGWGASGNPPAHRRPDFDDVKVGIDASGSTVPVKLIYPQ